MSNASSKAYWKKNIQYIVYFKFINPADNNADNWLRGISPEGIGTLGMFLNFAIATIIASFTKRPPENVLEMIERIRVPQSNNE